MEQHDPYRSNSRLIILKKELRVTPTGVTRNYFRQNGNLELGSSGRNSERA